MADCGLPQTTIDLGTRQSNPAELLDSVRMGRHQLGTGLHARAAPLACAERGVALAQTADNVYVKPCCREVQASPAVQWES